MLFGFINDYLFLYCAILWTLFTYFERRRIKKYIDLNPEKKKSMTPIANLIIPFFTIPLLIVFFIDFFGDYNVLAETNILILMP